MKITDYSDNELIAKYIAGNESCIEVLINRHKKKIYTYILITVKKPHIADDIFQDTFIKIIKSLRVKKYNEEGKFVAWAIRIAHNLAIDYFRKEKNNKTYSNDANEIDIFNSKRFSDVTIEDKIVTDQIHQDVRTVIDELPADQREVILLRHYGDYSFKEISEQTGVSINTALGRMRYGIINMRKIIEEKNLSLTAF